MKKSKAGKPFTQIIKQLEEALADWDKIPKDIEPEIDEFRKKTRDLVQKLNDQIKELDL